MDEGLKTVRGNTFEQNLVNWGLLDLYLIQVKKAHEKAQKLTFSDHRKDEYRSDLKNLIEIVEAGKHDIKECLEILEFVSNSLEYLSSSSLNLIPYESVYCLTQALEEWLPESEKGKHIIVTSLLNDAKGFKVDVGNIVQRTRVEAILENAFVLRYKLLELDIPVLSTRDHLTTPIFYHELGHYIDGISGISTKLAFQICNAISDDENYFQTEEGRVISKFIFDDDIHQSERKKRLAQQNINRDEAVRIWIQMLLQEYFADLFCCQYTGECAQYYLLLHGGDDCDNEMLQNDAEEMQDDEFYVRFTDTTHPRFSTRHSLVKSFLSHGTTMIDDLDKIFLQMFNDQVTVSCAETKIKGGSLNVRYKNPDEELTSFKSLLPVQINTTRELHGIFECAWKLWNDKAKIKFEMLDPKQENSTLTYTIINNLTEKSISNFITCEQWNSYRTQNAAEIIVHTPASELPPIISETLPQAHDTPTKTNMLEIPAFPTEEVVANMTEQIIIPSTEIKEITPGYLNKTAIKALLRRGELQLLPLLDEQTQIGDIHVDFRLGYDFLVSEPSRYPYIDTANFVPDSVNLEVFFKGTKRKLGEKFLLYPHQTVLAVSLEYIRLPDTCTMELFMRNTYSRLGLSISSVIHPAYCGCVSFELTNNNSIPINLTVGARIIKGIFYKQHEKVKHYNGEINYVCLVRPVAPNFSKDMDLLDLKGIYEANQK